jgi:exodeoxyribonuclease V gamma subunit
VHPRGEIAAYAEPSPRAGDVLADGLLKRLQRDLFHRRGTPGAPLRAHVDRHDPTLQIHACHTRLREVQVLHDQLRALLEDPRFDPPLQPRDIAVLAPDIDPYAPYVEAVFGGRAGQSDFIPYALADASPLAGEPLAEVFLRLLALPVARFGLHEVLDLLASPPLAAANGLDAVALDRLADWLQAAGARWGLDARHRARHGAPEDDAFTWRFALDRLLLGHASGDDAEFEAPDGTMLAPWPELEGNALEALDVLLRLLRVLERHERVFADAMTPAQWRERLLGLLGAVLPESPDDPRTQRALARLHALIAAFAACAAEAGSDAPVPPEVVRAHFATALAEADTRAPLLTGGVSFGRMVPMRLLPFRALCVLGLNDGDYPRRDPVAGLNRLAAELGTAHRRFGDRSVREDDRFLFLQLFASAGDVLYLSYLGADARDGSVRAPSVLLGELLDVAAAQHEDADAARAALVVQHPLQPFTPAAFGDATEPRRFSYRREWHPAAGSLGGTRRALPAWQAAALPARPTGDVLTLAELRRFLREPATAFLRERLALRLPESPEAAEDLEPLLLPAGGLERYALDQAVLQAAIAGDEDRLAARLRARGLLPSGPLATRELKAVCANAGRYAELLAAWRGDRVAEAITLDVEIDGLRVQGRIDGVHGDALARLRMGAPSGPSVIRDGLDWLLANAAGHACALVQFHDVGDGPVQQVRPALAPAMAIAALQALLRVRADGLVAPLPWGAYSGWAYFDADTPEKGLKAARDRWYGQNGGWGEGGNDALRLVLRGRALFDESELLARFVGLSHAIFVPLTRGVSADAAEAAA